MKQWFESLDSRERFAVMAGSLLLGVFMIYALVLQPAYSGYQRIERNVTEQRVTANWMEQSAARVRQLTGSSQAGGRGLGGRSLLAITDSTARAGGLAGSLKRIEPEGSNGVRVWLEGASFDDFVAWLVQLDGKHGIAADSASLEKNVAKGRVDVRLTLQAASL